MNKLSFISFVVLLFFPLCMNAQNTQMVNEEISLTGHIDYLRIGFDDEPIPIDKNVKANYVFKLYFDPSDMSRPQRKTVILYCDVDWKALSGEDKNIPIDWSWSGKNVMVASQVSNDGNKAFAIVDGNTPVASILPNIKNGDKQATFVNIDAKGNLITNLRPGMHIDDMARTVQKEIPGTRVVLTGKTQNGLKEYVLLSYGENKVYDVTGDYHYELNNNEPYFTFWCDSQNKLVKWFKLK